MAEKLSYMKNLSVTSQSPISLREQVYLSRFPNIDAAKVGEYIGRGQQYSVYAYGDSQVIKIPRLRRWYPSATADEQKRDLDFLQGNFPDQALRTKIHVAGKGNDYCVLQKRIAGTNLTPEEDSGVRGDFEEIIEKNRRLVRDAGISLDFFGLEGIKSCIRSQVSPGILPELSNLVVVDKRHVPRQTTEKILDRRAANPSLEAPKENIYGPVSDESISTAIQDWLTKESAVPSTTKESRIAIPDFTLLRLKDGPDSGLRRIIYRIGFKANRFLMKKFWGEEIA